MAVPTSSPSPSPTPHPASQLLHGVWEGIVAAAESSPWLIVLFALAVALAITRFVRELIHSGPRDDVRRFSRADKAIILRRAGGRCEHHVFLAGRCRETLNLEADHVHPHSKGGWTNIANGQALCHAHNRAKRASIPWDRQLRALERRRQSYFPAGESPAIVRHASRGSRRQPESVHPN